MSNGLKFIFTFSLGAAVGSVVTWKLVKTKYEKIAQEEIDSVKEAFDRMNGKDYSCDPEEGNGNKDKLQKITEAEKIEYASIVKSYNNEKGGSESMQIGTPPYVISPDDFEDIEDYEVETLIYYDDGILTDDADNIIEDVENTVGLDFKNHYGEYEGTDDVVYIRNDRLRCDYEICRDGRNYSDVVGVSVNEPDQVDEE